MRLGALTRNVQVFLVRHGGEGSFGPTAGDREEHWVAWDERRRMVTLPDNTTKIAQVTAHFDPDVGEIELGTRIEKGARAYHVVETARPTNLAGQATETSVLLSEIQT